MDLRKRCYNCTHGSLCFIRLAFHDFADKLYDKDIIGFNTDGVLFETNWIKDLADEHLPKHCERNQLDDRFKKHLRASPKTDCGNDV